VSGVLMLAVAAVPMGGAESSGVVAKAFCCAGGWVSIVPWESAT
jgi:hypothetical protein